jgi:hypothetical protein
MRQSPGICAVCGSRETSSARISKVVVEGRALELCRTHVSAVVAAMPETFDDLRALFSGARIEARAAVVERRSLLDRRSGDDRRMFPPRPEGRRMSDGRRTADPRD